MKRFFLFVAALCCMGMVSVNALAEKVYDESSKLYFELDDAWVCVRPSGTEPKIKYYIGVSAPTEQEAKEKIDQLEKAFVE